MSLVAGTRLGAYEIRALLGTGGMGQVYRATDAKLGRDVAIKVLPPLFAADSERVARFAREAQLLAALNHPNISAINGVEDAAGVRGLVLELVEGPTLADRVADGPLPADEAIAIARQIADALEAAHERGIVHRDLKPGNIKLTHGGRVKVLDFGIAKVMDAERAMGSHVEAHTATGTREGVVLGTASYMSPEQAQGRPVDARTDIWAFGCVVYEMLAGKRAFDGETIPDTVARVLEREPDFSRLPQRTPPSIRRLLQRCLEKDPRRRLHHIADARLDLDEAPDTTTVPRGTSSRLAIAGWMLAAIVAGATMAQLAPRFRAAPPTGPVSRFTVVLPAHVALGHAMALSPDGRTLVYSATDDAGARLYKRTLDRLESVPIRGTDDGNFPFFSPDGASIGFSVGRALKRVPVAGGTPATVFEAVGPLHGATWLADDSIVFGSASRGLLRVPASGGNTREVTVLAEDKGEVEHLWPVALPGDRGVLFTVHFGARDSQRVDVVSLASGNRSSLALGNGAYSLPTGHIAFQRGGSLWIAPFDEARLALTAPPTVAIEGVDITPAWSPILAVGRNGSIAYATGGVEPYPPRILLWVDRQGREAPVDAPARAWWWPEVSPDGKRLGLHIMDPVNMDAWIYELDDGPLVRVTYDARQDGYPVWTPDGKHIVFWSRQAGGALNLYLRSADLSGADERLTTSPNNQLPFSWARGGKSLVFQETSPDTGADIGVVSLDAPRTSQLVIRGQPDEARPAVSPDGRWIAYQSNLSGRWEVYVQPFPDLGGRWQVSTQGGTSPIWHPGGRELFYRHERAVMSVPVDTAGGSFRHGNPKSLFGGSYVADDARAQGGRSYALAPDGRRFLMLKEERVGDRGTSQIVVVENWAQELRRR